MDNTSTAKTVLYSFTAGYMVSQFDILGFALGCGVMMALKYINMMNIMNFVNQAY